MQLKEENINLKRELARLEKLNSELEQNFEYSRKMIDQLEMVKNGYVSFSFKILAKRVGEE